MLYHNYFNKKMTFIGYSYKVLHLCDKLLKHSTTPYKYKTTAQIWILHV